MNAHNRIIQYSQGFKRVAGCLGGRPRCWLKLSPQAGGNPGPIGPEWPRVCGVTGIFTILERGQGPSHPPSHVCVLTAEQGRGGAERKIASWLHRRISVRATIGAAPTAHTHTHASLLYLFFIPFMPHLPSPASSRHSEPSFPRTSVKTTMASPSSSQFPAFPEQLWVGLSVLYVFTPAEKAWDGGFFFGFYESQRHRGYLTFCPGCCNSLSSGYTVQIRFLLLWWQAFSRHCNCRVKTAHFLTGKL